MLKAITQALYYSAAIALFLAVPAVANDELDNDVTPQIDAPQTVGKSCMSLCTADGEDMLTCLDYCTMVASRPTTLPSKSGCEADPIMGSLKLPISHF